MPETVIEASPSDERNITGKNQLIPGAYAAHKAAEIWKHDPSISIRLCPTLSPMRGNRNQPKAPPTELIPMNIPAYLSGASKTEEAVNA
jgi:hypothetical protein